MSVERPVPPSAADTGKATDPGAMMPDPEMLQILSTEHWSLLATRSMTWNESFARAGMFFTVLSGAVVALALVAQATSFGAEFVTFALVLLPVVIFVGVATFFRIVDANNEDTRWVMAMNRIRAGYLERRPDLARFFTTSGRDDFAGMLQTFTGNEHARRGSSLRFVLRGLVTTPSTLAAVVSAVAGVLAGTVALELSASSVLGLVVGAIAFAVVFALLFAYQFRAFSGSLTSHRARFPTPPESPGL